MKQIEVAVIGGGLAGMITAFALARGGRSVALVAAPHNKADKRTTALMDQSIRFLERLTVWEKIAPSAAALTTMRIIDGTSRLLRAPTVSFRASEIGLDAFGYNIPNAVLLDNLSQAIEAEGNVSRIEATASEIAFRDDGVAITLDNGDSIEAAFIVGADGRNSMVRETLGIKTKGWSYPQSAMVLNFSHSLPHQNISTEFHTESGPFTQVPLPGRRSSLVWVQKPTEAAANAEKSLEELGRLVEERMQSMLGQVTIEDSLQVWPLSGMTAYRFGKGRAALIGEAAHVFPPIGAQGLNLSLRDIMALKDLLKTSETANDTAIGMRFDRKRQADVRSRTLSVDLLNRSLLSDFLPVQFLRSAGLHLLSTIGPLRSVVMREGIEPLGSLKAFRDTLWERVGRKQA
jgi:2-octaprenyl-6-methoxyphenol hydroxylase